MYTHTHVCVCVRMCLRDPGLGWLFAPFAFEVFQPASCTGLVSGLGAVFFLSINLYSLKKTQTKLPFCWVDPLQIESAAIPARGRLGFGSKNTTPLHHKVWMFGGFALKLVAKSFLDTNT